MLHSFILLCSYNILFKCEIFLFHSQAYWKDKIVFKFGNARKGLDKFHPDVISRKKKNKPMASQEDPSSRTFVWGLGQYLPAPAASEEETSVNHHILALQREFKKNSADVNVDMVSTKIKLTFPHRRHLIVSVKENVSDVIETFPWLQSRQEVCYLSLKLCVTTFNLRDVLNMHFWMYLEHLSNKNLQEWNLHHNIASKAKAYIL